MSALKCAICGHDRTGSVYRIHRNREDPDRVTYTCVGDCSDTYDDAQATIKMMREDSHRLTAANLRVQFAVTSDDLNKYRGLIDASNNVYL